MLCEKCGVNNATMYIRSVVNGKINEKHLCASCAMTEGYSNTDGNNLSQILSSMLESSGDFMGSKKTLRCSCCGSTFSDISESGKCGCAECYSTFYEQLLPYLKRVHGSIKHIGKTIDTNIKHKKTTDTAKELRILLNQLVCEEKYEEAAVIRDKIRSMESEM